MYEVKIESVDVEKFYNEQIEMVFIICNIRMHFTS